jgi:DNA polymerase III alpha subunit
MSVYIELHAHSYYSLLDGCRPEALVTRAANYGMPILRRRITMRCTARCDL